MSIFPVGFLCYSRVCGRVAGMVITAPMVFGAFVAWMVFGNTIRNACVCQFEFVETEGQRLMLIAFTVFGAALLPEGIARVTPTILLYSVLSLTLVRVIPVVVSVLGTDTLCPDHKR